MLDSIETGDGKVTAIKKKTLSVTQKLKKALEEKKNLNKRFWDILSKLNDERSKNDNIMRLFPKHYYKIEYKAMSTGGFSAKYEKIVLDIHPKLAVQSIADKTNDFELISIEQVTR